uniref:Uncharacterized protein n=1 Tax=Cacopsylla melanoneura TaxID=428564 RepID=A0A8D8LB49_9HEMI
MFMLILNFRGSLTFKLLQNPFPGAWLNSIPCPNLGTLLDNDTMRICVGLRLGCTLCRPHQCACGEKVDPLGHHGLRCCKNPGRYSRHAQINEIIKRALPSTSVLNSNLLA